MWELLHRRGDGSFVITLNGKPYHVVSTDPLFEKVAAEADGVTLDVEPRLALPEPGATELAGAVNAYLESVARSMDYKSAVHCASYAPSTVAAWRAEAAAFIAHRDAVWTAVFAINPERPPASIAAFLATLPAFTRPTP